MVTGDTDDYSKRMGSIAHMMCCPGHNNFKYDFVQYGCHCRHERRELTFGNPVDVIDWHCPQHQWGNRTRYGEGCNPRTHHSWSCVAGNVHCPSDPRKDLCLVSRCKCDYLLALRLFPCPVWDRYRSHSLNNCSRHNQWFAHR